MTLDIAYTIFMVVKLDSLLEMHMSDHLLQKSQSTPSLPWSTSTTCLFFTSLSSFLSFPVDRPLVSTIANGKKGRARMGKSKHKSPSRTARLRLKAKESCFLPPPPLPRPCCVRPDQYLLKPSPTTELLRMHPNIQTNFDTVTQSGILTLTQ